MTIKGHCFCKETKFEYEGDTNWECYCHCDDCRRNCAAPVVGWLGVPVKKFKWTGLAPNTYQSDDGVSRHFCGKCGTPMGFEAEHYPGDMHVYAASLENPENFKPTFHVFYASKLPWLELHDDLPKYDKSLLHSPLLKSDD